MSYKKHYVNKLTPRSPVRPGLLTMTNVELDRLGVVRRVIEGRLLHKEAEVMMGVGVRQVARLGRRAGRYKADVRRKSALKLNAVRFRHGPVFFSGICSF